MNRFWSKRIQHIVPYTPGEQPKGRQFVKLNTNECPYPPSPRAVEAINGAAGDSLRLYPDPECEGLRAAIARRDPKSARLLMEEHLNRYKIDAAAIRAAYPQYFK